MGIEHLNWDEIAVTSIGDREKTLHHTLILFVMGPRARDIVTPDPLPKDWHIPAREAVFRAEDTGLAERTPGIHWKLTEAGRAVLNQLIGPAPPES